ncbi:hypothetical protein LIMO552_06505 [Listeria monocytogenes]
MKITTKGRYGLTITLELAKRIGDGPISLRSIAQDKNLSDLFVMQELLKVFAVPMAAMF